jgi:hypothetical protein
MNHLLLKEKSPTNEEMLEDQICENFYQEDPDEFFHVKDPDETLEDEVVEPCEEVINSNDIGEFMEKPLDTTDNHIDDSICVQKCGWDIGYFGGDPIYDINGNLQIINVEAFPLEGHFSYMEDQDIWKLSDDTITNLFHPLLDRYFQCTLLKSQQETCV